MAYEVPAMTLHFVLESLQESSGKNNEKLVIAAGLNRFLRNLPPESWEPVAEQAELTRLFTAVYKTLGESLARNFLRTWGQFTGEKLTQTPLMRDLRTAAQAVPPA